MSWMVQIGISRGPIEVQDGATVRACVTAALMAAELSDAEAVREGHDAWRKVVNSPDVWTFYLPDGRSMNVWKES